MDFVIYLRQCSQAPSFLLEASDHENARTLVFFLMGKKKGASFIFRKKDLGVFFFWYNKVRDKKKFTIFFKLVYHLTYEPTTICNLIFVITHVKW